MSSKRVFFLVFILAILWEIFAFLNFPKQAWVQGLVESWFVSKGLFFYKDFAGTYMPLLRMLMVSYHSIFGYTQEATIFLSPIISIMTLTVLFYAGMRWLVGWNRLIPIVFFALWNQFLGGNHFTTTAFLALLLLITAIVWWSWQESPKTWKAFLFGILASVNILTLQLTVPFIAVLLIHFAFQTFSKPRLLSSLKAGAIGFAIPTAFVFALVIINGALTDFYYWTIVFHFTSYPYSSLGRGIEDLRSFLAVHSPLIPLGYTVYLAWHQKNYERLSSLSSLFLFLGVLTLAFWFAVFHPLRFQTGLPIFGFALAVALQEILKQRSIFYLTIGILLVAGVVWFNLKNAFDYILPKYEEMILFPAKRDIVSYVYRDDPMFAAVEWIKTNTPENARIFVLGDLLFYFESQRLISNARGASNIPTYFEPFELFLKDIVRRPPDYWVIDERDFRRFKEFGYGHLVPPFQKLLECQDVKVKFDYLIIRKQTKIDSSCLL